MYIKYNPNPLGKWVGDCAVRAISKALYLSWDEAFDLLAKVSKAIGDMQNANSAIDLLLRSNGFYRKVIPDTCPFCYTANDFCKDHSRGIYVLGFGNHVATVIDGDIYDSSEDSTTMIPLYYYGKE